MPRPVQVGARELKTRLGRYLNRVRRGERFIVTDRHEPVAELRPFGARTDSAAARLERLVAAGRVTPPSAPRLSDFEPVTLAHGEAAAAVTRDRDERP